MILVLFSAAHQVVAVVDLVVEAVDLVVAEAAEAAEAAGNKNIYVKKEDS